MKDMFETIREMNAVEFFDKNRQIAVISPIHQGKTLLTLALVAKLLSETAFDTKAIVTGLRKIEGVTVEHFSLQSKIVDLNEL